MLIGKWRDELARHYQEKNLTLVSKPGTNLGLLIEVPNASPSISHQGLPDLQELHGSLIQAHKVGLTSVPWSQAQGAGKKALLRHREKLNLQ